MKKAEITREDVLDVANDLKIKMNEQQIKAALELYPSEQKNDPTATWDLVMENAIYQVTDN